MSGRILVVDDDQSMCELIAADLQGRGIAVCWYTAAEKAFQVLQEEAFDTALVDLNLPGMNGIELCERIAANRPDVPVIVITAFGSLETAVAAIRAGAYDFVTKPIEMEMLALTVQRAIDHHNLQHQVKILNAAIKKNQQFDELIGESPAMRELYAQLTRIADSDISVFITGETGTGKELVARALHRQSRRRNGPFVPVNCSALPATLLESELFGYKRGAFTDARAARKGLFLQADGGTLFFDEIGDFPLPLQPKLLRSLEEHTVRPLGAESEEVFDARIIAATNRDMQSAVEEGRFREDLFYRLNVVQMELPPLQERGTDILLLAQHFIKHYATRSKKNVNGISNPAAEKLMNYHWPGNVRELRNAMERAVALTLCSEITVEDLAPQIRTYGNHPLLLKSSNPSELVPLPEVERRYILHVLETVGGNRTKAAQILGLDRKTLYRKLQRYGQSL